MAEQEKAAGSASKKAGAAQQHGEVKGAETAADTRIAAELKDKVCALIDSLLFEDREQAAESFEHMLSRAGELVRRKQAMEGTKGETRDLIGEVMFTRLRRAFRDFLSTDDASNEIKCAEWVMGVLYSAAALSEFATALDRAILETSRPQDYSFAGRADFISVEEVLQLLGSGSYTGMLGIEKDDNRVDIYLHKGHVAFLDPHHLGRRVLPGEEAMNYREIPEELVRKAEGLHADKGLPLVIGLVELGFFQAREIPEMVRTFGLEVLFEFLREQGACSFFYRKMDELPDFVAEHRLNMAVTPILLEGSKRLDDWTSMLKVFPDPSAVIEPVPDMFARISSLDLDVMEIKMLAMVNGESSPKDLVPAIGLPLMEVYQSLVRFAREGVLVPPGGLESLSDVSFSVEESMERAFEALDANDDALEVHNALDAVLGSEAPKAPEAGEKPATGILETLSNAARRAQDDD